MSAKLSKNQIIALIIGIVLVLIAFVLAVIMRFSYSTASLDESAYSNAKVSLGEENVLGVDSNLLDYNFESAKMILDEYNSVFRVECLQTEHCYHCTKYICRVIDTIKNDIDENGKNIIIYQWNFFEMGIDDEFYFNPIDYCMPMRNNQEYLVFTEKKDYCDEYLETLKYNEYSQGLQNIPTAFAIDNQQSRFVDLKKDTSFSSLDDINYICFSDEALNQINNISEKVIKHYCYS